MNRIILYLSTATVIFQVTNAAEKSTDKDAWDAMVREQQRLLDEFSGGRRRVEAPLPAPVAAASSSSAVVHRPVEKDFRRISPPSSPAPLPSLLPFPSRPIDRSIGMDGSASSPLSSAPALSLPPSLLPLARPAAASQEVLVRGNNPFMDQQYESFEKFERERKKKEDREEKKERKDSLPMMGLLHNSSANSRAIPRVVREEEFPKGISDEELARRLQREEDANAPLQAPRLIRDDSPPRPASFPRAMSDEEIAQRLQAEWDTASAIREREDKAGYAEALRLEQEMEKASRPGNNDESFLAAKRIHEEWAAKAAQREQEEKAGYAEALRLEQEMEKASRPGDNDESFLAAKRIHEEWAAKAAQREQEDKAGYAEALRLEQELRKVPSHGDDDASLLAAIQLQDEEDARLAAPQGDDEASLLAALQLQEDLRGPSAEELEGSGPAEVDEWKFNLAAKELRNYKELLKHYNTLRPLDTVDIENLEDEKTKAVLIGIIIDKMKEVHGETINIKQAKWILNKVFMIEDE